MPPFHLSPAARNVIAFIAIHLGGKYLKKNFPDLFRPQLCFPDPSAPPVTSEAAHKATHRLSIATGPHSESLIAAVVACSPRFPYPNALPMAQDAPIDGQNGATCLTAAKVGISPCDLLLANEAFRPGSCPPLPHYDPAAHTSAYTRSLCGLCATRGAAKDAKKVSMPFIRAPVNSPFCRPEFIDQVLNPSATHLSTQSFVD
ncbi:hypothetical protein BDZ89DRAFT_1142970 [Hymenopellis radicata]|nr:hypothetical protein BDZ89DRAFT_1142970 [Hymenopellis radicata]